MTTFRTPLRYPGGKQRIWEFIDEVLRVNTLVGCEYAEPYAGGAGIACELLLRRRVSKIHLNDSCIAVYSFWHSILNEPERFCRKIFRASLTVDEWKKQREVFKNRHNNADRFELGFATFYLNRCNRSGILTGGLIGGLKQHGMWKMDARFPRNDLITRIEGIAERKSDIRIRNWDAERFLVDYVPRLSARSLVYCDPPYFRKAERLYPNHYKPNDHGKIASVIQALDRPWLVSYDACRDIRQLYSNRKRFSYLLQYNASRAYKGRELFILADNVTLPVSSNIRAIQAGLRTAN